MSSSQWTVFVLLLVLLGMEALKNPSVSGFFKSLFVTPFQQSITG